MVPESKAKQSVNVRCCEAILADDASLLTNRPTCTHTPTHTLYILCACVRGGGCIDTNANVNWK